MALEEFGRNGDRSPIKTTTHNFRFLGSGSEFFGIWIVNILLTIVTLGIYSAWAKVRTKRYFYGNTQLADYRFDYLADPVKILKGRIIVIVALIALNLISQISPIIALIVTLFYFIVVPWLIVRGLSFNANMTSYRGIRFRFENTVWNAFKAYIMWPILSFISLSILTPFASKANVNFLANGFRFGQSAFHAQPSAKPFYKAWFISLAIILVPLILLAGLAVLTLGSINIHPGNDATASFGLITSGAIVYLSIAGSVLTYIALSRNVGFNSLELHGGHRFRSTVKPLPYCWIVITNSILILITIFLYTPWAKVRLARYLADNTSMIAADDLDGFVSASVSEKAS